MKKAHFWLFVLLSFISTTSWATVYYACGTATWNGSTSFLYTTTDCSGTAYNPNSLVAGDEIVIQAGAVITVVSNQSTNATTLTVYGSVFFKTGSQPGKLTMSDPSASLVLQDGSNLACVSSVGGPESSCGNSSQIVIGGFQYKGDDIDTADGLPKPSSLTPTGPVPVELTFFKGYRNQLGVQLQWQTAMELNNDYFEIELSVNGESFTPIARIKGAGTSSDLRNYEWLHGSPIVGINYYRLKQVDFNGSFEYSGMVAVKNETEVRLFYSTYPQPAADAVTIDIVSSNNTDPIRVDIIKLNGELATSFEVEPSERLISLDLSEYENGLYLIRVSQSLELMNGKLLIQH